MRDFETLKQEMRLLERLRDEMECCKFGAAGTLFFLVGV